MATLGNIEIDPSDAANPVVIEKHIRSIVNSGDRFIHFSGCDYAMVSNIASRLWEQGIGVIGYQESDGPPEYFTSSITSTTIINPSDCHSPESSYQ